MSIQIPFGLQEGRILSIEELNSGFRLPLCLPSMRAKLIARKGKENQHHFAHYQPTTCEGALESALHLKAKAVIEYTQMLMLPAVYLHRAVQPSERKSRIRH